MQLIELKQIEIDVRVETENIAGTKMFPRNEGFTD